jgi:hypothetical protein
MALLNLTLNVRCDARWRFADDQHRYVTTTQKQVLAGSGHPAGDYVVISVSDIELVCPMSQSARLIRSSPPKGSARNGPAEYGLWLAKQSGGRADDSASGDHGALI